MLTSRVVSVDARVLRLLNLQANTEIDYQTYASMLKQVATASRGTSTKMTTEEVELITREFRRARTNAMGVGGRIKLVPVKVKVGNINTGNLKRNASQQATSSPTQPLLPAAQQDTKLLGGITNSLANVIKLLTQQNQQVKKDSDDNRKNQERARRAGLETNLERGFTVAKTAAQALVAPFKSIIDQIINYFLMIFLGRAIVSLLNWFADPQNQSKVRSILRFLRDWWPTLMGAYILFGTGFGKVVRKVAGIAVSAVSRLAIITARLVKAIATGKGLKGAAAAIGSGGGGAGWKGALVKLGVGALATVGTTMAVNKMMGGGEDTSVQVPEAPANPMLAAAGGGLANLSSLFGNISSAASQSFAPFTAFFSNGGLADVMHGLGGVVRGEKGIDKIPAMLSDGEFVMSRGAVQKFGVNTLESMNSAGGGTNIPKVVSGKVYAAGGGFIGGVGELREKYDAKYGAGAYDKESARRKAQYAAEDAAEEAKKKRKPTYIESDYVKKLRERIRSQKNVKSGFTPNVQMPSGLKTPRISVTPNINFQSKKPKPKPTIDAKEQADIEARKKARTEYLKIINNPDDPRYQDAWDNKITINSLKANYMVKPQTSTSAGDKKLNAYTPYQSKFAGARDSAFDKAKRITGGETSQQRLDRLSSAGKGKGGGGYGGLTFGGSIGKRFDAEAKARKSEYQRMGGFIGQLGRVGQRMFGGAEANRKLDMQQMASNVKVKQAGAASIGKYYSSSDGKYYGNYEQAQRARQARLAKAKPNAKSITPTPKPAPKVVRSKSKVAGGGMGGGRGSGAKPSVPKFPASSGSNRKAKNVYGIK